MRQKKNLKERFENYIKKIRASGGNMSIETLLQFTVSSHPCYWSCDETSASYMELQEFFPDVAKSVKEKIQTMGVQSFREHARAEYHAAK